MVILNSLRRAHTPRESDFTLRTQLVSGPSPSHLARRNASRAQHRYDPSYFPILCQFPHYATFANLSHTHFDGAARMGSSLRRGGVAFSFKLGVAGYGCFLRLSSFDA